MKAIIAEKPSVANELARIIGATEKRDGYFEGGGFFVTWAFGHLVGLAMPEEYGIKGFNRESLPIIPSEFKLNGRKVKSGNGYVYDEGSKKQLEIIDSVFRKSDSIIVATDAGREGEVIFRFIYQYLGCTKPFERLWINSLTEKAIIQGFQNLKQGSEFNGLFAAGRERSQCDWLVGINATQALTIAMGDGLFSLGRVQTPTLAMICKRFLAHKAFEVKNYFQLELSFIKEGISFRSQSEDKWDAREKTESIMRTLERCGNAEIKEVEKKSGTIQAPLLFDLTGLQKEANKKLGYSAERTLEIAQKLYEKKFITYPRTGSKYIPEDIWPEIPTLILALGSRTSCKEAVDHIKWERYNKHIVNDVKVTDHHGILITENIPTRLEGSEDALYDMIAKRLLESISPPCHREITDIRISALHYDFKLKAIRITSAGWKLINGNFEVEGEDLVTDFPDLQTGMQLNIDAVNVLAKKTKPPMLYTEADLLATMENVGSTVENEEERKILKNIGIGTPATRAAIIETLFDRGYILREKKSIVPTDKGMLVYEIVGDKKIADAAMTAQWEIAFEKIENGEIDAELFHAEVELAVHEITNELLGVKRASGDNTDLCCPKCKGKVILREKVVKCRDEACDWVLFRNICGVQLSYREIDALLVKGRTPLIKKMMGRNGKSFNAYILLDGSGSTSFEFEQKKKGKYK
ncbi:MULTISPECIES: type IA DNA topoisomerase [Chryseobacterium]|uniref:DNA topoisomerase n=2 Tax=Chryseobacterium gleum TaxID=250 RepID=A0A3S4M428_CHRGE|nr:MULTISPECIES: type IA DNA topoisomerase [Chryseobacterium]HAF32954.1 type IA DNA topoisomerase [Sphingobacterium sp.]EFK36152.1 DNA topoisomerase [Chryseobacterium gleum ATCC 35910]QQY31848.1 topoisomerase C-terminal repeat-containing protein [Chryseobacterium gleum]VEE11029.1 DNA topoisomerase 3 [Chryseobacterium gleum]VFA43923.1 DNA topoisomerase 3 [Chryseobacterium indologenes]